MRDIITFSPEFANAHLKTVGGMKRVCFEVGAEVCSMVWGEIWNDHVKLIADVVVDRLLIKKAEVRIYFNEKPVLTENLEDIIRSGQVVIRPTPNTKVELKEGLG